MAVPSVLILRNLTIHTRIAASKQLYLLAFDSTARRQYCSQTKFTTYERNSWTQKKLVYFTAMSESPAMCSGVARVNQGFTYTSVTCR